MIDSELLDLYRQGFIPGPQETEEAFLARIAYNRNLHGQLDPAFVESSEAKLLLQESSTITRPIYGFELKGVPILFSNEKLGFLHGGCAWIFQKEESCPIGAFFQLRSAFRNKKRYLGLYNRKEILAHEALHVARMAFEEPKYEEILAYKSSLSPFRRKWGALFRTPKEMLLFIVLLALFLIVPLSLPATTTLALTIHWAAFALPFIYLFALAIRLALAHRKVNRLPPALLPCLTDDEIDRFSGLSDDDIVQALKGGSLRERLLLCLISSKHHHLRTDSWIVGQL